MPIRPGLTVLAIHHVRGESVCSDLSIEDADEDFEVEDPLLLGLSSYQHRHSPSDELAFISDAGQDEVKRARLYTCTSPDIRPFLDTIERKLSSAFLDKLAQTEEAEPQVAGQQERRLSCETSSMMLISDPLDESGRDSLQMMSLHKIFHPKDADSTSIATSLTSAISSMNRSNRDVSFMLLPPVNRRAHMHRRVSCDTLPSYDMILSSFSSSRFCLDDLTESSSTAEDAPATRPTQEEVPQLMQVSSCDDTEERDMPPPLKRHHHRVCVPQTTLIEF